MGIRVRGMLVLSQRRLIERKLGHEAVQAGLRELTEAERVEYDNATILSWVPQNAVRTFTRAAAESAGMDPSTLVHDVVRESVEFVCRGPWKVMLKLTSDEALLRRSAMLFSRSFDQGELRISRISANQYRMAVSNWPEAEELDFISLEAGVRAILGVVQRPARIEREGETFTIRLHSDPPPTVQA